MQPYSIYVFNLTDYIGRYYIKHTKPTYFETFLQLMSSLTLIKSHIILKHKLKCPN